ncbi:sirohydrochlorin chelatase [Halorhabdus amylolytica]|uniref:sirohydrochlorin chelatase n=1 Tax=Halorhabdus amylolytica TaxID=2559573 RepID=UPI0010A9BBF8|nr:sirohydrochlorin chelatase [Halorhabdus amylolytica]
MTTNTPVVLAGHGSRRNESNEQVRAVAAALESRLGDRVVPAFIELAEPHVHERIAELAPDAEAITVVPLALFAAGHVKNEVPLVVQYARQRFPDVAFSYGSSLRVRPELIEIVADRIEAAEAELDADRHDEDVAVVFVGRGSSDPNANADAYRLARFVQEGRAFSRVEPTFVGITEPQLDRTLREVARHDPDATIVVPYMLGDGVLTQRVREDVEDFDDAHPGIETATTDVLGVDERLVRALEYRVQEARTGTVSMSCDTCTHKVSFAEHGSVVDGETAFVDALEHTLAHVSDAHDHSHDHGEASGHDNGHGHTHEQTDDSSHDHGQTTEHEHGHDHERTETHEHGHGHDESRSG